MFRSLVVASVLITLAAPSGAQIIFQPPFDTDYSYVDLGSVPTLPANAGGLTFKPGDPNTLLIGGAANGTSAKIYSIGVTRDGSDHVTGFTGTLTQVSTAAGIGSGGIDGGLSFGPGGLLFYTSYSDNSLGQIKPGSGAPDLQIALGPLGVTSSVGALAFVPAGFPGAGRMKLAQYNSPGNWYDVVLAGPDQNGTYPITSVTLEATIGFGPEGIIYVSDSNPQFSAASVLVSEYSGGSVSTYEIDSNGDPVVATRRVFLSGLTGAEGAVVDPLTGDFLFSTYGGGNRVIVVKGFVPPPSTTTTTTSTTTPTTTTSTTISPTTTSSTTVITTTSSSTTTVITSSTTSTTAPAGCAQVPPGATLASVVCRLAALRDATAGATGLGSLREKSLVTLSKAIERTDEAVDICGGNDVKKARSRLKQVRRHLIQFSHRLRANSARKKAPPGVREPLADEADSISADSKAVRAALACPGAAAGIP